MGREMDRGQEFSIDILGLSKEKSGGRGKARRGARRVRDFIFCET